MYRASKFRLILLMVFLGEVDWGDPDPGEFIKVWLYSHAPVADRVAFALQYDPREKEPIPQFVPAQ